MKIKFFKTLAIACVLCMSFATLTAFADVTVITTTNYDYEDPDSKLMTITTNIAGLEQYGEITYYVENQETKNIVYIDQATAENKTATFTFTATKGDVLAATAKHGSDKEYPFPTFEFNYGCNLLTQGTPHLTETPNNCVYNSETKICTYQGKISGAVKNYGVKITVDGEVETLYAMGCDAEGNFAIQIENISEDEFKTVKGFVE